jgi:hypothetical protein
MTTKGANAITAPMSSKTTTEPQNAEQGMNIERMCCECTRSNAAHFDLAFPSNSSDIHVIKGIETYHNSTEAKRSCHLLFSRSFARMKAERCIHMCGDQHTHQSLQF